MFVKIALLLVTLAAFAMAVPSGGYMNKYDSYMAPKYDDYSAPKEYGNERYMNKPYGYDDGYAKKPASYDSRVKSYPSYEKKPSYPSSGYMSSSYPSYEKPYYPRRY